jgi:hypothetical protein
MGYAVFKSFSVVITCQKIAQPGSAPNAGHFKDLNGESQRSF